ncbi:hypothetical protein OTU49_004468, partial [Cherax quadricarinatus]
STSTKMSANGVAAHCCETPGCNAEAKLQCPTCIKLNIQGSFFCSQNCFKGYWESHKLRHKKPSISDSSTPYNPWPYYAFSGSLRPYPQTTKKEVPPSIGRPDYADDPNGFPHSEQKVRGAANIKCLSDEEKEGMRVACKLAREVLDEGVKVADIGVATDEIDRVVHEAAIERECYPSPLNYHGFPKSCCTSVNEVICHGIPDMRPLQNGDICNIDVTVYHRNFHGDLNETLFIGEVSSIAKNLVKTTWECLQKSIEIENKAVGVMKPGHTFTIEPMISEGTWKDEQWPDNWTAVTADGKLSAQFEETLLVTDTGVEVLTQRRDRNGQPYFMD